MDKFRIYNGMLQKSTDDGKTYNDVREATEEEIKDYEYHKAEKQAGYGEKEAYGEKGLKRLNELRARVELPPIEPRSTNPVDIDKAVKQGINELQQYSGGKLPELVYDFMLYRNPKPNNKLIKTWQSLNKTSKVPTMSDVHESVKAGKLSKDDVVNSYKDQQWWFRAVVPQVKKVSKDEYDKLMNRENFVSQNNKKYWVEDLDKPYEYTTYITDEPASKTPEDNTKKEITRDDFKRNPPPPLGPQGEAPWWLQDIIKVAGAVGDKARIKRYMPWQATPQVRLPEVTFYDPTRELAANAEQANIAAQAAASFTDPRQLAAQTAATQGLAGKNAADIMARYNNLNVGLSNQLSQERTSILNQASQNKAALDTQLADKYTILNQQFDNANAQARQNIRQSYIDAITNRANTANMNSLFPQYAVDPSTGGFVNFTGDPNRIVPNKNYNQADFQSMFNEARRITGDDDRAMKFLEWQQKMQNPSSNQMPNTPGGYPA
jgi:hypothetical protein